MVQKNDSASYTWLKIPEIRAELDIEFVESSEEMLLEQEHK